MDWSWNILKFRTVQIWCPKTRKCQPTCQNNWFFDTHITILILSYHCKVMSQWPVRECMTISITKIRLIAGFMRIQYFMHFRYDRWQYRTRWLWTRLTKRLHLFHDVSYVQLDLWIFSKIANIILPNMKTLSIDWVSLRFQPQVILPHWSVRSNHHLLFRKDWAILYYLFRR